MGDYINSKIFGSEEMVCVEDSLIDAIEDMTGFAPQLDWTLDQCGLSSVGLPQLATRLSNALSTKTNPVNVIASQLVEAKTINDIVSIVEEAIDQANADGI